MTPRSKDIGSKVTRESYERIEVGMTYDEVADILGPGKERTRVDNFVTVFPKKVGPAGVEPAMDRVSDGCLAAWLRPETKRPVRDSNPSHLFDKQTATPAASQGSYAVTSC